MSSAGDVIASGTGGSNVEAIMSFMLPIMFSLFKNITNTEYKKTFKKPCEFDSLVDLFGTLPPYFNEIGKKYATKPDLLAYYSMQLASTFLVNNGSLTMACLIKMLDLQSRLGNFSIGIMDYPEENNAYIGLFGIFMKPNMKELRGNAMLKIIEYVDKYEKNTNNETVTLFNLFNSIFVVLSMVGICANLFLILILKHVDLKSRVNLTILNGGGGNGSFYMLNGIKQHMTSTIRTKSSIIHLYKQIRKRYKTRMCFQIIAVCHIFYLMFNFIIMSQAKLASIALKNLNEQQFACKLAFMLFPPTTAYTFLHQLSAWLIYYVLFKNSKKMREIKMKYFCAIEDENNSKTTTLSSFNTYNNHEDDDDVNDDLTSTSLSFHEDYNEKLKTGERKLNKKHHNVQLKFNVDGNDKKLLKKQPTQTKREACCCFNAKKHNFFSILFIFLILLIYNMKNLFLYSLNKVTDPKTQKLITYCAFEQDYSPLYDLLEIKLIPILNLVLFLILPVALGLITMLFDVCFLIRLYREKKKFFAILKPKIEFSIYVYFLMFMFCHLIFASHQISALIKGTPQFPFIFPLFIRMTFTTNVWLVIIEMLFICIACSSDFFIWLATDQQFRQLVFYLINKHILCKSTANLILARKKIKQRGGGSGGGGGGVLLVSGGVDKENDKANNDEKLLIKNQIVNNNNNNNNQISCSTSTTSSSQTSGKKEATELALMKCNESVTFKAVNGLDIGFQNIDDENNENIYRNSAVYYPDLQQENIYRPPSYK